MTYSPAHNSYECWRLAIAAMREISVRKGDYAPRTRQEQDWAAEGWLGVKHLDTIKAPPGTEGRAA